MKRSLVILSIGLCLGIAANRLYKFSMGYMAPAKPGQCITLEAGTVKATVKIIANNSKKAESLVVSYNNKAIIEVTYAEMRQLNVQVVECPK